MYYITKNEVVLYQLEEEPIFRDTLQYPIKALDVKDVDVVVVDTIPPSFEIIVPYVSYADGFFINNQEAYDEVLAGRSNPVVPKSISPAQIRLQLTASGLRETVETTIAASTDYTLKDWWEYSLGYERDNVILVAFADSLGLTAAQVDELFIAASKL